MKAPLKLTISAVLAAAVLSACGGSSKPSSSSTKSSTTATRSSSASSTNAAVTGSSTAQGVVVASAGAVRATLRATSHHPKVNAAWPISFTVTKAGRPLRAHLSYEYLFAGNVVAKRSKYTFTGHFSDLFRWPASAVGYPLTFRAVILAGGQTLDLDYPVQVGR